MSIVTHEAPASVPVRQQTRRPRRIVEVRITHKRDGDWEIERESEFQSGLMYLIAVTADGQASHVDGPSCPLLICAANSHGKPCRHLEDAPGLTGYGVEIANHLGQIAQERAFGVEWRSEEFIDVQYARIAVLRAEAEARYGVHITKIVEESAL